MNNSVNQVKTSTASSLQSGSKSITVTANSYTELLIKLQEALSQFQVAEVNTDHLKKKRRKSKKTTLNKDESDSKKIIREQFSPYCTLKEAQDDLQKGKLVKGAIRISIRNNKKAYITNEDHKQRDYILESFVDRNRALDGDVVAIQLQPQGKKKKQYQTAIVVHILERVHSRITVGFLKPMPDNNKQFIMVIPRDYRVPQIRIQASDCPDFYDDVENYKNILCKAKITAWTDTRYATGSLVETIGTMGELQAETAALLVENQLNISSFPAEVLENLSLADTIPTNELQTRRDLRGECVFTIDPFTAHDLDDALSCKKLENGNFEVGVHIADVTYYLKEDTPLDKIARERATSVYLINDVHHMLPETLCFQCSFAPGADKLAFSVFWEMTECGRIIRQEFARTVINCCAQLAYEHCQIMIDCPEETSLPIFGGFTYKDISAAVNYLQKIALNLRGKRFSTGALRMDRPQLNFRLDEITGEPVDFCMFEYRAANKLVEEFMLLANTTVAQKIVEEFPDQAFLRNHKPPNQALLENLHKTLESYKMKLDISSSKALQLSIWNVEESMKFGRIEMAMLYYLIAKPMRRADYFCSVDTARKDHHHYALSLPVYTHFTSPIRRYADVIVHRLLASSLGYTKKRQWKIKNLVAFANNCNRQKCNAKCASDASSDLFLVRYIAIHYKSEPFIQEAAIIGLGNNYVDIIIPLTGSIIRIYPKKADNNIKCSYKQHVSPKKLVLTLPETPKFCKQECNIFLFSIVKVILFQTPKKMRLGAKLWRPINIRSLL